MNGTTDTAVARAAIRGWLLAPAAICLLACCEPSLADGNATHDPCDSVTQKVGNEVTVSIPDVVIDEYRNTSEDLAVMAGMYNDLNTLIGGITSANPLIEYDLDPNLAFLPDQKGVCARPAIKLKVGYSSLNIYMSIDIPRNSCLYNAIFAHEMHHVNIYRDYIEHHLEDIKKGVEAKFNGRTYTFNSLFEAKQYTEILGQVYTQHLKEQMTHELNAEQSALDTQTEYSRIQLECFPAGHF